MPLIGKKVLGQKRIKNKLVLFLKDKKTGRVTTERRDKCKCPSDKKKPCKCK